MNVSTQGSGLFLRACMLGALMVLSQSAVSATVHIAGYAEVNQYALPAGVPGPLGDVMFSEDGNMLYIVGGSASGGSQVWTAPVTRDASGAVIGFGTASQLFAYPNMEGSLEHKAGTDSMFFRIYGGALGQRLADEEELSLTLRHAFGPHDLKAMQIRALPTFEARLQLARELADRVKALETRRQVLERHAQAAFGGARYGDHRIQPNDARVPR